MLWIESFFGLGCWVGFALVPAIWYKRQKRMIDKEARMWRGKAYANLAASENQSAWHELIDSQV